MPKEIADPDPISAVSVLAHVKLRLRRLGARATPDWQPLPAAATLIGQSSRSRLTCGGAQPHQHRFSANCLGRRLYASETACQYDPKKVAPPGKGQGFEETAIPRQKDEWFAGIPPLPIKNRSSSALKMPGRALRSSPGRCFADWAISIVLVSRERGGKAPLEALYPAAALRALRRRFAAASEHKHALTGGPRCSSFQSRHAGSIGRIL